MFSCEFCKIFKNTFFTEHIPVTASAFKILQDIFYGPFSCKNSQWFLAVNYFCKKNFLDEEIWQKKLFVLSRS